MLHSSSLLSLLTAATIFTNVVQVVDSVSGDLEVTSLPLFSDQLSEVLYENPNECTSSLGISMAFSLVLPGIGPVGETEEDLCSVLGLCSADDTTTTTDTTAVAASRNGSEALLWSDETDALTSKYNGACLRPQSGDTCGSFAPLVKIANTIWVDSDDTVLLPEYEAVVGDFVRETNFSLDSFGATVNSWVEESTEGLIDSIIDEGPSLFDLIAINSIYLKASWQKEFDEFNTRTDYFYSSLNSQENPTDVRFMHSVREVPYSDNLIQDHQVISLAYEGSSLSMILALPYNTDAEPVDSEDVLCVLPHLETRRVALGLPKFSFETTYKDNLKAALEFIGLEAPFDSQLGFCGLGEGSCHFVEQIIQKTFIEIDEKGTTAAAVTALGIVATSLNPGLGQEAPPMLFLADHPFQFFIYDEDTGILMFEGRVGAPPTTDIAAESRHTDETYWQDLFGVTPEEVSPDTELVSIPECPMQPQTGISTGGTESTAVEEPTQDNGPGTNPPAGEEEPGTNPPAGQEEPDTNAPAGQEEPDTNAPAGQEGPDTNAPVGNEEPDTNAPVGDEDPESLTTNSSPRGSFTLALAMVAAILGLQFV